MNIEMVLEMITILTMKPVGAIIVLVAAVVVIGRKTTAVIALSHIDIDVYCLMFEMPLISAEPCRRVVSRKLDTVLSAGMKLQYSPSGS